MTVPPARPTVCQHPPARLWTWYAYDGTLCVVCCDCREVLAGAAEPIERKENREA